MSPHGSFRLGGTVARPLAADAVYDLDNVTTLMLSKAMITQKRLKELYGLKIQDYATAHGRLAPPEEKNRCWRLPYADEVNFNLDSLPSLAEEKSFVRTRACAMSPRAGPARNRITDKPLRSGQDEVAMTNKGE